MTIDLLPTIAKLAGAAPPPLKIDGMDIGPLIHGEPGARNPHEAYFFYYETNQLQAVSSGRWKLHLPHTYRTLSGGSGGTGGQPARYSPVQMGLELYDLETDVGERTNVAAAQPAVVRRLEALAEKCRDDLGDSLTNRIGKNVRAPGRFAPESK
jgi:arylsulfatase A-like enzyme